jgi:hypothetical protein
MKDDLCARGRRIVGHADSRLDGREHRNEATRVGARRRPISVDDDPQFNGLVLCSSARSH